MNKQEIRAAVIAAIMKVKHELNETDIEGTDNLVDDLAMDSLDIVEAVIEIEKYLNISIDDDLANEARELTVNGFCEKIEKYC